MLGPHVLFPAKFPDQSRMFCTVHTILDRWTKTVQNSLLEKLQRLIMICNCTDVLSQQLRPISFTSSCSGDATFVTPQGFQCQEGSEFILSTCSKLWLEISSLLCIIYWVLRRNNRSSPLALRTTLSLMLTALSWTTLVAQWKPISIITCLNAEPLSYVKGLIDASINTQRPRWHLLLKAVYLSVTRLHMTNYTLPNNKRPHRKR